MLEKVTNFKQNVQEKKGVSPVIGVILMVAVTVILSAVIGTFVLGLGNNINENPNAGVQTKLLDNGDKRITVVSMDNADTVEIAQPDGTNVANMTTVGESTTVSSTANGGPADSYSVIAHQGSEQALIQTVEFGN